MIRTYGSILVSCGSPPRTAAVCQQQCACVCMCMLLGAVFGVPWGTAEQWAVLRKPLDTFTYLGCDVGRKFGYINMLLLVV